MGVVRRGGAGGAGPGTAPSLWPGAEVILAKIAEGTTFDVCMPVVALARAAPLWMAQETAAKWAILGPKFRLHTRAANFLRQLPCTTAHARMMAIYRLCITF